MTRHKWVYPSDGSEPYEVPVDFRGRTLRTTMIASDLPVFVSPIDGKPYSGRAGLREHNLRHNVINNEELVGLPTETMNKNLQPDRRQIRENILETMHRKGYM